VVGQAQPGPDGPLTAPLSETPCVYFHMEVRRRYRDSRSEQTEVVSDYRSAPLFRLVDATGSVLVNPVGAAVDAELVVNRFEPEQFEGTAANVVAAVGSLMGVGTTGYEKREWVLRPGTRLYVLGEATDLGTEVLVGQPGDEDAFTISRRSQAALVTGARRTQRVNMWGGLLAAVVGVTLLVYSFVR
jgi:hypothetical protein